MNPNLIQRYESGGEQLVLAIRGLTPQDMLCLPDPAAGVGKWSIQQVVVHCMDSELISTDRLKRMIAEENPTLIGYDQSKFASGLYYDAQPADQAATIVGLNRRLFANVLRKLPEPAFARTGQHNERGTLTVGGYLQAVIDHLEHHIGFIHRKRARMGKEIW